MDSLTARHLARELDERWRGRPVDGYRFDRAGPAVSLTVDGKAVIFDLSRPDVTAVRSDVLDRRTGAMQGWSVAVVRAPVDDRRIIIELLRPGRFKGSPERRAELVVSALPRARGAVLRDVGGARLGAVGADLPPAVEPRPRLDDDAIVSAIDADDASALLVGRWMSPFIARWMIANPTAAVERYHLMCSDAPAEPARCGAHLLPFPFCANAVLVDSLIDVPRAPADERVADNDDDGDARRRRAVERMRAELERAADAPRVRAAADALVALGDVAAPGIVTLADGSAWPVDAEPGERAADAAARLYAEARSKERALSLLPSRVTALRAAPAARPTQLGSARPERGAAAPRRPYRTYRSSGGLEIWVGRGAASNDALTFGAAAPNDVWLHARDAAGAHVVLRWTSDQTPPARDLRDAAMLAAWHSKSRGASLVPVDWTRRKYVRKPRGAAPGTVLVREERTLMVRPSAERERAMRDPR